MEQRPDSLVLHLSTAIGELPSVSARQADRFAHLGVHTLSDLIRHLPTRYEQLYAESTIDAIEVDHIGSARGTVVATRPVARFGRARKSRFQATLQDPTGQLDLVWFNADYLQHKLHPGMTIRVQGKIKPYKGSPQMINPRWEPLQDPDQVPVSQDRLRPVYPATEQLPSLAIESLIHEVLPRVLPRVIDPLPEQFLRERAMPLLDRSFLMAHEPENQEQYQSARRRLAYNELLLLQLGIAIRRHYIQTMRIAPALNWSLAIDQHIRARFPFQLTKAQTQVVSEIAADLQRTYPMNRLLQGDVGSGKTVVALYALLVAVADRKQGALMAPTELLAQQHYRSISDMLKGSNVRIAILTGGQTTSGSAHRAALLGKIAAGKVALVIGTQALLSGAVKFNDLAVIIIDEQHRFGVMQRAALRSTQSADAPPETPEHAAQPDKPTDVDTTPLQAPHCLVMTATPIPRTLSLTLFGDLDISTIQGLPPGRTPITTRVVKPDQADKVYTHLAQRLSRGEQAYVVVPTIDESGHPSTSQLKDVRAHMAMLSKRLGSNYTVAAVHGQLKSKTREAIMAKFRKGDVHVLVATTVIEVGVDVPNATVMIIEHAERFGLAQLHQLRGRVGRGTHGRASLCVFIADPTTDEATARMKAVSSTSDGFEIAEHDLQIRGMGDFFGTRQHGLPPLRIAQIPADMDLLQMARRDAHSLVESDPYLSDPVHELLRQVLVQQYGDTLGLIDVG